jgi:hypothetical protein
VVADLSFNIDTCSSSSLSSAVTSSSPSSSLASSALGAACDREDEACSGLFSVVLDGIGGDEDREPGREEAREGEVAGEGALLELATCNVVGLNT